MESADWFYPIDCHSDFSLFLSNLIKCLKSYPLWNQLIVFLFHSDNYGASSFITDGIYIALKDYLIETPFLTQLNHNWDQRVSIKYFKILNKNKRAADTLRILKSYRWAHNLSKEIFTLTTFIKNYLLRLYSGYPKQRI